MKILDGIYSGKIMSDKITDGDYKRYVERSDELLGCLSASLEDRDLEKLKELLYYIEACNDIEKSVSFTDGVRLGINIKEIL